MGLIDDIREQAKKSGTNKGKFIYFKSGTKVRVRFLQDMDAGMKIPFHDSFTLGINTPCQELFGRKCKHCDNDELRHRDQYLWSVWEHETKSVKLILAPVNSASPVPGLVGAYDAYGNLMDRDYVITRNGTGTGTTFSVVGMDKSKFKNTKAKPFSKSKILEMLDKAFPDDGNSNNSSDDSDDDESNEEYDDMSTKELYDLCKDRGIEAKAKKSKDYYIELLEANDDESEDEDDDDWDDAEDKEEVDYDEMSTKELFNLCKENDIKVAPRKSKDYYIKKLKENEIDEDDDDADDDEW